MKAPSVIAPIFLIAAGLLVYWPGLYGGFIFDDFANLVTDRDWKATSLSLSELHRAMSRGVASEIGRPLALLTFALNHATTGMATFPLKLTGLLIHLINGLLVWRLCHHLLELVSERFPAEKPLGKYAAALIALAWLLHPIQVSTVLYIVQRMEVGAHTGVILALLSYLNARAAQKSGSRAWPWFTLFGAATLVGIGFKETALLVPLYAMALEIFVLKFKTKRTIYSGVLKWGYGAATALGAVLFFAWILPTYSTDSAYAFREFSLHERLLTQSRVLVSYLGHILIPNPSNLLFYYDNFPISRSLLDPPSTLTNIALLLALAFASWSFRNKLPLIPLGIAWFFAAHALTSNVVPLELAFEHRNYFALLGILLALAQAMAALGSRLNTDAKRAIGALPIILLAGLCAIQVHTWAEPFRLALALETRNPGSPRASYDLAKHMLELSGHDRNAPMYSIAKAQFEHAANLPGSPVLAEQALIIMQARSGQSVPDETWERFRAKLSKHTVSPQEAGALRSLLDCRIVYRCALGDQQLMETFLTALEHNPDSAVLHTLYANFAYNVLEDRELAIRMAREASVLSPNTIEYQVHLAQILAATAQDSEELRHLQNRIIGADNFGAQDGTLTHPSE